MAYETNTMQPTNGTTGTGNNSQSNIDDKPIDTRTVENNIGKKRLLGSSYAPLQELTKNGTAKIFSDVNSKSMEALNELRKKGYAREFGGTVTIEFKCEELIDALCFNIEPVSKLSPGLSKAKDFSLVGSTNVDETIMNSKILDPDIDKLTPVFQSASDKIKSEDDPFYNLDQERPESVKQIMEKEKSKDNKKIVRVASRLTEIVRKSPNKMLDQTVERVAS